MDPATIDGVTFVLPDMSWAELQDTSPAIFVPRLRRENMRLSLGWFAINMTRVYKHMVKALQPETGSNRERKRTKKAMLKRWTNSQDWLQLQRTVWEHLSDAAIEDRERRYTVKLPPQTVLFNGDMYKLPTVQDLFFSEAVFVLERFADKFEKLNKSRIITVNVLKQAMGHFARFCTTGSPSKLENEFLQQLENPIGINVRSEQPDWRQHVRHGSSSDLAGIFTMTTTDSIEPVAPSQGGNLATNHNNITMFLPSTNPTLSIFSASAAFSGTPSMPNVSRLSKGEKRHLISNNFSLVFTVRRLSTTRSEKPKIRATSTHAHLLSSTVEGIAEVQVVNSHKFSLMVIFDNTVLRDKALKTLQGVKFHIDNELVCLKANKPGLGRGNYGSNTMIRSSSTGGTLGTILHQYFNTHGTVSASDICREIFGGVLTTRLLVKAESSPFWLKRFTMGRKARGEVSMFVEPSARCKLCLNMEMSEPSSTPGVENRSKPKRNFRKQETRPQRMKATAGLKTTLLPERSFQTQRATDAGQGPGTSNAGLQTNFGGMKMPVEDRYDSTVASLATRNLQVQRLLNPSNLADMDDAGFLALPSGESDSVDTEEETLNRGVGGWRIKENDTPFPSSGFSSAQVGGTKAKSIVISPRDEINRIDNDSKGVKFDVTSKLKKKNLPLAPEPKEPVLEMPLKRKRQNTIVTPRKRRYPPDTQNINSCTNGHAQYELYPSTKIITKLAEPEEACLTLDQILDEILTRGQARHRSPSIAAVENGVEPEEARSALDQSLNEILTPRPRAHRS